MHAQTAPCDINTCSLRFYPKHQLEAQALRRIQQDQGPSEPVPEQSISATAVAGEKVDDDDDDDDDDIFILPSSKRRRGAAGRQQRATRKRHPGNVQGKSCYMCSRVERQLHVHSVSMPLILEARSAGRYVCHPKAFSADTSACMCRQAVSGTSW